MVTILPGYTRGSGGNFDVVMSRTRQPAPFRAATYYERYGVSEYKYWNKDGSTPNFLPNRSWANKAMIVGREADDSRANREAKSLAYDRLISRIKGSESASLGETCAEWEQATKMIVKRSKQLLSMWKRLKSFDFPGFLREAGFRKVTYRKRLYWTRRLDGRWVRLRDSHVRLEARKAKLEGKKFSSVLLEWDFGWKPFVGDIQGALNVYASVSPPALRTTFSGSAVLPARINEATPKPYFGILSHEAQFGCRYVCDVQVTSGPAVMLRDLGLTNPLSVLWAITPFSFVVDWFVGVQKWLDSASNLVGLSLSRISLTERRTDKFVEIVDNPWESTATSYTSYFFRRSVLASLPTPGLFDRPYEKGFAAGNRARDAVAVLVGFLKTSR